ncbi:MAG: sigma-E factor negative regulatory protein RseB [Gammaproteobacteria bacterium]
MKAFANPILLSLLLVSGVANAGSAMDWVQRMSDSMRNLSYRGNFVYLHENQLESMQISHFHDDKGEKERLVSLNGEAREVLRDNQNLTCIWPSSRKIVVDFSRKNSFSPIFIPEDIARIEKFYEMKLLGRDRIASMDTVVIHIMPKDQFRYGMKFWINEANGLMMKSSLINENGKEVEQVMFTQLELLEDKADLMLDQVTDLDDTFTLVRFHSGDSSQTFAADQAWRIDAAPGGFWRESVFKREVPGTENFVQQMVYTDGLASLSVFIEKDNQQVIEGGTSMGAVNAFMRVMDNYSVTAIGEVPAITVKQVAESIFYQLP